MKISGNTLNIVGRLFFVVVAVGCQESVRMGTVVRTDALRSRNGSIAPNIPVRSAEDGEIRMLDRIGYPFYIVGFVEPPTAAPCHVDGHLRNLANRLSLDSIVVAQIIESTPQAPLTGNPAGTCPVSEPDTFLQVYDPDGLAWQAFGRPSIGSVFLIDRHGMIVEAGRTDNLAGIRLEADRLQREWVQYDAGLTGNGYRQIYAD